MGVKHAATRKGFEIAIDRVLKYVNKKEDREENLLKLVDISEKFMGDTFSKGAYQGARELIKQPDGKWMKYANRLLDEINPNVAKMTALNLGFESAFYGTKKINEMREVHGCNVPWLIQVHVIYIVQDAGRQSMEIN